MPNNILKYNKRILFEQFIISSAKKCGINQLAADKHPGLCTTKKLSRDAIHHGRGAHAKFYTRCRKLRPRKVVFHPIPIHLRRCIRKIFFTKFNPIRLCSMGFWRFLTVLHPIRINLKEYIQYRHRNGRKK